MRHPCPAPRRPPLWCELALVIAAGLTARGLGWHAGADADVQLAFWPVLIVIGQAIWAGLQVVAHISLVALHYIVIGLNWFVHLLYNGIIELARTFWTGFRKAWRFIEALYDHVLKPAWQKFWKFIGWARDGIERIFRPVFEVLRRIRTELLAFYTKFVRPVLDTLDLARKILGVARTLGLEWAQKLDAWLANLQEQIDRPFRFLLAELNKVINLVNRVVTADGLFQRLALVRSIERDIRYVSRAFVNWRSSPLTAADVDQVQGAMTARTLDEVRVDTEAALVAQAGPYEPWAEEMAATIRGYLL